MRTRGDIVLVSCYELGHQPFHLASLMATLQAAEYAPVPVDTAVDTLSDEIIQRARFIGISVPMHTALRLGEQIAQRIRQVNPAAHICFYGLYALLNAEHLLRHTIDSAIGGEYETPLLNLIRTVEAGHTAASQPVPGVYTREAQSGPWIQHTPFLVPERRELPEPERYARLERAESMHVAGYTETTRGCKHTCAHCPITPVYQGRFFAVPRDIVMADIRAQVARGTQHITFGDPDFWNGPTHALRIVRMLHQEFPDVTFDATIKIEHLLKHQHLLPEMKEAGCVFIVSALESLNDTVLQHLQKGHSAHEAMEAMHIVEAAGISLRPSLLPFTPWETLGSYIHLLDFFEENHFIEHLDPVHLSIRLLIPPGSAILHDPDCQHWLGPLDPASFSYRWQHPDPRMDTLQQQVAQCAEKAACGCADPIQTFFQVKALALQLHGQDFSVGHAMRQYGKRKTVPRLSESWFCCAEPTTTQLIRLA